MGPRGPPVSALNMTPASFGTVPRTTTSRADRRRLPRRATAHANCRHRRPRRRIRIRAADGRHGEQGSTADARFPGLPIARVREFRFQSRTFDHEIEFRYVSLHAGQKSPVRMYLDGFRYLPKTTSAIEPSNSVRVSSADKLPAELRPKPQTATDEEVVKRIVANWRARQLREIIPLRLEHTVRA